jgi:hypothetical protein
MVSRQVLFRTIHLFKIRDVRTGLVWATQILTDPFHDIKLYCRAPSQFLRDEFLDHTSPPAHPADPPASASIR